MRSPAHNQLMMFQQANPGDKYVRVLKSAILDVDQEIVAMKAKIADQEKQLNMIGNLFL